MRILVIEDNRDILANVLDYLQLKGFGVDCAQDGLSGLHLASTGHYDLIVLDIMLPGIDGYQVCKRLREDGQSEVPILMLTARDALDDRLHGLNVGADDYLQTLCPIRVSRAYRGDPAPQPRQPKTPIESSGSDL